ncbi:hypothetical protein [Streptomyces parvus]|uniref:hypothetical protein n=1 Tax=Streptomyces parvus TaxID=66428 RepID=UPI003806192C
MKEEAGHQQVQAEAPRQQQRQSEEPAAPPTAPRTPPEPAAAHDEALDRETPAERLSDPTLS